MTKNESFASRLYHARMEPGKKRTQAEVAEAAGISVRQYQNLEIGRDIPGLDTALRLSKVLNFSLDDLESPEPKKE